uniref:Uncharacterized protein n=1 Tax=Rhizophora mucronata TaxID=61149 RepID=A0A2P2PSQ0_RHIMU
MSPVVHEHSLTSLAKPHGNLGSR